MTFHRIEKIEIAYVNAKGVRRVGKADGVTSDGEAFRVQHKQGYFEIVNADQIVAS
ncbi:hypothetical protein [Mesorhizobium sp.]|uniref:hypothetical protein n=1 Tax=Mesorhizobium sp. TaxID=1871066 RepID=UPI0025805D7E|nr:hypothetical protein [Mesorhizobium sp.]